MTAEATPAQVPIAIRPAVPGDLGLILKSHLLTLRHSSHMSWHVENSDFFAGEQRAIKRVMARPTCRGLVACPEDDPEIVLGFLLYEPGVLHSLYTKAAFRRQGVARSLLRAADLDPEAGFVSSVAVHDSTKGWLKHRFPNVRFNPYSRGES